MIEDFLEFFLAFRNFLGTQACSDVLELDFLNFKQHHLNEYSRLKLSNEVLNYQVSPHGGGDMCFTGTQQGPRYLYRP